LTKIDNDTAMDLAMSILKQLCETTNHIPECLMDLNHLETKRLKQHMTMDILQEAFRQVASRPVNFIIIIDGLDELENSADEIQIRKILVSLLELDLKIFATSRQRVLHKDVWSTILEIGNDRNAADVESFVSQAIKCREPFYDFPEEKIKECAAQIAKESRGR
jgi:replicative superfamily II helicase